MDDEQARFEIIEATGPGDASVELWDKSLAPGGLAFEAICDVDGAMTLTGYNVAVPLAAFEGFLREAKDYLAPQR